MSRFLDRFFTVGTEKLCVLLGWETSGDCCSEVKFGCDLDPTWRRLQPGQGVIDFLSQGLNGADW